MTETLKPLEKINKKTKIAGKLQDAKIITGKVEKFEPTTLEQLWSGDNGTYKYKTMDAAEYEASLKEMSKADLHEHAANLLVVPVDNKEMLFRKLMKEFNAHVNQYRKPANLTTVGNNIKVSPEVLKILAEGR